MDELCNQLLSCNIDNRPKLYDMMIFDFVELSRQYSQQSNEYVEYTFDVNYKYEHIQFTDINELSQYIQKNKSEDILADIIRERYPHMHIDKNIVASMIDYYLECLQYSQTSL
jgi:hypothetical protein